jgi:predicted nucleic acid-binding protein
MKYVLDSSVSFKWAVVEQDTPKARRVRHDFLNALLELLAPDVFPVEIAHALTRAERQGRITPVQGAQLFTDILKVLPLLRSSLPLLPRAYEISSTFRVGVYDCLYVALAEQEGCELLTADDKLVKNLQSTFPFIIALSSLP